MYVRCTEVKVEVHRPSAVVTASPDSGVADVNECAGGTTSLVALEVGVSVTESRQDALDGRKGDGDRRRGPPLCRPRRP